MVVYIYISECLGHGANGGTGIYIYIYIYIRLPGSWGGANGGIYIYIRMSGSCGDANGGISDVTEVCPDSSHIEDTP